MWHSRVLCAIVFVNVSPAGYDAVRFCAGGLSAGFKVLVLWHLSILLCCLGLSRSVPCRAVPCRAVPSVPGADWWESRGEPSAPPIPPDSVFDSVLRDLLSPPRPAGAAAAAAGSGSGTLGCTLSSRSSRDLTAPSGALSRCSSGVGLPAAAPAAAGNGQFACSATSACAEPSAAAAAAAIGDSMLPRSAPPGSLLCRLALHALVFGNARAVAALWQRFVIQVRGAESKKLNAAFCLRGYL